MSIHDLKCQPEPFRAMQEGLKTFEFRKDDRGYVVGDELFLREWAPSYPLSQATNTTAFGVYTGQALSRRVTYILRGPAFGVPEGYVIMSVVP